MGLMLSLFLRDLLNMDDDAFLSDAREAEFVMRKDFTGYALRLTLVADSPNVGFSIFSQITPTSFSSS